MADTTPRGRAFRQALLGDVEGLSSQLAELRSQADVEARAYAGMVVTRRVVLNLKSGTALAGLVVGQDGPLLEVADVTLLEQGSEPQSVDGRVVVERADVDFVQVL